MENTNVQLRKLSEEDIRTQLKKTQRSLLNEKISLEKGRGSDTNRAGRIRKEIAQLKTVLTEQAFLKRLQETKEDVIKK